MQTASKWNKPAIIASTEALHDLVNLNPGVYAWVLGPAIDESLVKDEPQAWP